MTAADEPPFTPPSAGDPVIAERRLRRRGERHVETHAAVGTGGWLRPFVLGAEDGIVSTAGLVLGVAAAGGGHTALLTAGSAGLVSGALSMAAGEYVSVAAQRDTERADIALETWELEHRPEQELEELTNLYRERGLSPDLAHKVAVELTSVDALGTHLREELAIDERIIAKPWQAAWLSALSFSVGAALPLATILLTPHSARAGLTVVATLLTLAIAGSIAARLGRSSVVGGMLRVTAGGSLAMAVTWAVGKLLGVGVA